MLVWSARPPFILRLMPKTADRKSDFFPSVIAVNATQCFADNAFACSTSVIAACLFVVELIELHVGGRVRFERLAAATFAKR